MYHSTTSFASASISASGMLRASPSGLILVVGRSCGNPSAALVPPKLAELLEPPELFRREDRAIHAEELVVQRTRIADADPALHVPLEARLDRNLVRPREVHDRLHHPPRPACQDLVELPAVSVLLPQP